MKSATQNPFKTIICTLPAVNVFFGKFKVLIGLPLLQIALVGTVIYSFVILTIKIAILLQYLRIFSFGRDTTFWVYQVLIWAHIFIILQTTFS